MNSGTKSSTGTPGSSINDTCLNPSYSDTTEDSTTKGSKEIYQYLFNQTTADPEFDARVPGAIRFFMKSEDYSDGDI